MNKRNMKSLFIIFVLTYSSLAFKCVLAEGVSSYSTTEKFLEDDRIKHTDWGLWITKFDEAKFDELVWYPTDELIAGLDALDAMVNWSRNDYTKKERRKLSKAINQVHGRLMCITEYPNIIGDNELQRIVNGRKILIPKDLKFADDRVKKCKKYIAVPKQTISFTNLDCVYFDESCHLQWVHTNKNTGKEEMARVSLKFHYDTFKNLKKELYELDLVRISGSIHFLPEYWYRELPLTQITKIERIIEEAVVAEGEYNLRQEPFAWVPIDDLLKKIGKNYIQNYPYFKTGADGYFMIEQEEAIQKFGSVAYDRAMALIPPKKKKTPDELRKNMVKNAVTQYRLAKACYQYGYVKGFNGRYIDNLFTSDLKNDLTKAEINLFSQRELALFEMMVSSNEGADYCGAVQLLLISGGSFFD